ncbi:MAG: hypothetical protein AMJ94_03000 [Deltaproteobacteria bacterium SM23_61]|nr:MAG: hypothetical protein AMJ94_03000 [Deltaproteobacteria bacterium SM23_61]
MALRKSLKKKIKDNIITKDFDRDIAEAKSLQDIERLERKDFHLGLLAIFIILVLVLFILFGNFEALVLSPREIGEKLTSFQFSAFIFPGTLLLLVFCAYMIRQYRKLRTQRREVFIHKVRLERSVGSMDEVVALTQIGSAILHHKDFMSVLEMIGRESLNCLRAHRSTVFLMEEKSGILKTQFAFTSDPQHEQVGLFEEKEMARKTLRSRRPFLLREPADFSDFLKYGERDRKITSLISIPLVLEDKSLGALSVVIIDEERKFSTRDLQFLLVLANQVAISMEHSYLAEEVRKGAGFRKSYEQHLDTILNQLQTLSDVERRRIEDHIGRLLPAATAEANPPLSEQTEELVKGTLPLMEAEAVKGDDRVTKMLKVDMDGEPLTLSHDLGEGGVFIRTPNPLDLGEEFVLKLHLAEGEAPIEVACKVVWSNKYGKESRQLRRGMGVKFVNLSPELQGRVESYIQSHKNRQFSFAEDQHHLSLQD